MESLREMLFGRKYDISLKIVCGQIVESQRRINGAPYEGRDSIMDGMYERALEDHVTKRAMQRTLGVAGEEETYKISATCGGLLLRLKKIFSKKV